jgi:hypothetical protein
MSADSSCISPVPEFDRQVSLADIPGGGLALRLTATAAECAGLARRYEVAAVDDLVVTARLRPLSGGRYRLAGRFRARVQQTCVVSLEPMESEIAEDFDVTFQADAAPGRATEVDIDAIGEDPPEPVVDGRIPVGETVAQLLALAIDPFPRSPEAVLENANAGDDASESQAESRPDSPFAILRKLR